jgi:hypothetical protein
MTVNFEDLRDKLKTQPLDELKRQRADRFPNRLSSTDIYELYDEEIKRRERLAEKEDLKKKEKARHIEIIRWTKLTFWVALITGIFTFIGIAIQLF